MLENVKRAVNKYVPLFQQFILPLYSIQYVHACSICYHFYVRLNYSDLCVVDLRTENLLPINRIVKRSFVHYGINVNWLYVHGCKSFV